MQFKIMSTSMLYQSNHTVSHLLALWSHWSAWLRSECGLRDIHKLPTIVLPPSYCILPSVMLISWDLKTVLNWCESKLYCVYTQVMVALRVRQKLIVMTSLTVHMMMTSQVLVCLVFSFNIICICLSLYV